MPSLRPDLATMTKIIEAFGLLGSPAGLTAVARGAMGRIWRLDLDGPTAFAVKELFWGGDESAIVREVAFRDAAAAEGVVAPTSLRTIDGTYLAQLPSGPLVRLYSWVEGRPSERHDPGRSEWLGRTLGVLHRLRHPTTGIEPHRWYESPPTPGRWDELVERLDRCGAAADRPWSEPLGHLRPQLRELGALVRPLDRNALIFGHRDLNPSNVLVEPIRRSITLLDWENAGPTDASRELAGRMLDWHVCDGQADIDGIRATMRAYRAAEGHGVVQSLETFSEFLSAYLNYLEEQATASMDPDQPTDMREHAASEVGRLVANVPDLAMLQGVVQACSSG